MVEANTTWVIIVTGIFILLLGIVVISILKPKPPKAVPKASTNIKMKPLLSAKVKAVKTRGYSKVSGYSFRGLREYDAGNCTYVPSMNPYVSMVVTLNTDVSDSMLDALSKVRAVWKVGENEWSTAEVTVGGVPPENTINITIPANIIDTSTNIACTDTDDRADNTIQIFYSTKSSADTFRPDPWATLSILSLGTAITTAFESIPDGTGTPLVVTLTNPTTTDITVVNTQFIPYKFTSKTVPPTVITGITLKVVSASANTYIMTYRGENLNIKVYQISTETEGYVVLKNTGREQDPYISFGADKAIVYRSTIDESNTFKIEMYSTNCSYTPWSSGPDGACPTNCGYAGGTPQTRTLTPATGGGTCDLPSTLSDLSRTCPATPPCYTCAVSPWSNVGICSTTCGGGTIQQIRSFTDRGDSDKCPDPLTQYVQCNTDPCPVNCAYSDTWNDWTPATCPNTCGPIVTQTRTKSISTPAAHGGLECGSVPTELNVCPTACSNLNCSYNNPAWSACSTTCGGGTQSRTLSAPPRLDGVPCPDINESQSCNTQLCPVNCEYSTTTWNDWTPACPGTCGPTVITQTRSRLKTKDAANGGSCAPAPTETTTTNCPTKCTQLNCIYNNPAPDWGWGACNKECDWGKQTRTLTATGPLPDGALCLDKTEERDCIIRACNCLTPVTTQTLCTKGCGPLGTQSSTTTIPREGGTLCGVSTSIVPCNRNPCPYKESIYGGELALGSSYSNPSTTTWGSNPRVTWGVIWVRNANYLYMAIYNRSGTKVWDWTGGLAMGRQSGTFYSGVFIFTNTGIIEAVNGYDAGEFGVIEYSRELVMGTAGVPSTYTLNLEEDLNSDGTTYNTYLRIRKGTDMISQKPVA